MGPDNTISLPSCLRCTWDAKNAPWTYGKGNADHYIKSVPLPKEINDALPDGNSNKSVVNLQGII